MPYNRAGFLKTNSDINKIIRLFILLTVPFSNSLLHKRVEKVFFLFSTPVYNFFRKRKVNHFGRIKLCDKYEFKV